MFSVKVVLVHDYLKEYGGAERVVEVLHEIFPDAPLYTAYVDLDSMGTSGKRFKDWDIKSSWLQKLPGFLISPFRVFAPIAFESFDLSEYDVVISSCNTYFSKAVITKPGSLHISYIHTPPRYLYGYTTSFNYKKNPLTKILGEIANHFLRVYDFETSQRPDILVANSRNVAERIKKFYRRDSVVIYPPVDVDKLYTAVHSLAKGKRTYFLTVGRLVRGKGMDEIVEACTKLDLPLKVAGTGSELASLKAIAGKNVEFLGQVSDEELPGLYANAKATILASEDEDFGIVAVESMACGTPVIAPKEGGFLETVVDGPPSHKASAGQGKTGILYEGSLEEALEGFNEEAFRVEDCRKQAEKFSKMRFKKGILALIDKYLQK